MKNVSKAALLAGAGVVISGDAQASVQYTTPGPHVAANQYIQNFDSLPKSPENTSLQTTVPWKDDDVSTSTQTSIPGWYLYHPIAATEGGTNQHQRFRIGPGSSGTGAFWSFGSTNSADRALGSLNADTISTASNAVPAPATLEEQQIFMGLRLTNGTANTLTSFTLDYRAEQWRQSGNAPETWTFEYSLDPTTTISSPHSQFTAASAGNFTSPNTSTTAGAIDGNAVGNFVVVAPFTVTGIQWAPGTDLWLRWADTNFPGPDSTTRADQGMGLDDLHFSANFDVIPEPAGLSLLALGAAALLKRRPKVQ